MTTLSERVHTLRTGKGMTLEELAGRTGFTKGYLSKVENGKATPPVATLVKLARGLNVHVVDLIGGGSEGGIRGFSVTRSSKRKGVVRGGTAFGYDYAALSSPKGKHRLQPYLFTFPASGAKHQFFEHSGEEFMFILTGSVEWQIGDERVVLRAGDSVHFDSALPHRGRAVGGAATALVVITSDDPAQTVG